MVRKYMGVLALGLSICCMSLPTLAQDDRTTITLYVEEEKDTPAPTEIPDHSEEQAPEKMGAVDTGDDRAVWFDAAVTAASGALLVFFSKKKNRI